MAALLFIFILTLVLFMVNYRLVTAEITQTKEIRRELLMTIKEELEKHGIKVQIDEENVVLRIEEGILFDSGRADIKESGRRVINKLGPILYDVLARERYFRVVETIFIEGHTDNRRIVDNPYFDDNWDLSVQRAINTWKSLLKTKAPIEEMKNYDNEYLFSVSGYAENRPVIPHNKLKGTPENRRIDFRFAMRPPKEKSALVKEIKQELSTSQPQ